MDYEKFFESFKNLVQEIKEVEGPVKVIGHLDADGLAAVSIIVKAFIREGVKFSVSILKQTNVNSINELVKEDYEYFLFVDLGSGSLRLMAEMLNNRKVFVLDHHKCEDFKAKNILHINPFLFGIDGDVEVSGAGIAYLFAKELNEKNKDIAYIAIVGAIGDMQENKGFKGINKLILKDAVDSGRLEIKKGLSMFGIQTRPIHKVLQYSTEPYIPGVTGSEEGAISFLEEAGIDIKERGKYKRLVDLNEEDMKKLITMIIIKRLGSEENPEDVIGQVYLLKDEDDDSPTKDAREFSTLLNSCGRLHKFSLGIGACLGNKKLRKEAIDLLSDYKKEIISALDWFYTNKKKGNIIERKGYVIINAEDKIKDTLIGTLASIISNSNIYDKNVIIISIAHTLEGDTKVSMRTNGNKDIDLRYVIGEVVKRVGGEGGGHKCAGGCLIPQEKEYEFVKVLQKVLDKYILEEVVK
jgi:RecJ-like exonuclease